MGLVYGIPHGIQLPHPSILTNGIANGVAFSSSVRHSRLFSEGGIESDKDLSSRASKKCRAALYYVIRRGGIAMSWDHRRHGTAREVRCGFISPRSFRKT